MPGRRRRRLSSHYRLTDLYRSLDAVGLLLLLLNMGVCTYSTTFTRPADPLIAGSPLAYSFRLAWFTMTTSTTLIFFLSSE